MISRLGLFISRVFARTCPDPFVIAILLTVFTVILALSLGDYGEANQSLLARATFLLDAWRADGGLWKLLGFGMQMCLVLVTGHALASTRPVRALIDAVAGWPTGTASAVVLVSGISCLAGLINWGLGLIVGALLVREVGQNLTRRNVPVHYPLIAAAGYMGLLIFHGGLSGSAPLTATTAEAARRVLPESAVAMLDGGVSLDRTLLSPLNLFVTGGLLVIIPMLFWMLTPKHVNQMQGMDPQLLVRVPAPQPESTGKNIPDKLDRSPIVVWLLALPLLLALIRYASVNGLANLQLNEVNAAMLAMGLILHGSPRKYMTAVEAGASDCGAIIIQFPIYAGIMALMSSSGLVQKIAAGFTTIGDQNTIPVLSFLAATVVGFFVPSGGGQWSVQGPIALEIGSHAGIDQGKMIMTIAFGDELANMLQPFWALPLLAITGVKARDIVGYTALVMLVSGAWMALGLLLF